jgi:hypothetical protein
MALYPVHCYSSREQVHLTNYADLIITDKNHNLTGFRFGGYPESVTGMLMISKFSAAKEMMQTNYSSQQNNG